MKTMYISEGMARRLREGVLKDALSVDVLDGLKDSPYGNIPSFMDGGPLGERFLTRNMTTPGTR